MKIVSWNVNGLRAVLGKGFREWLNGCGADVVCLQETKCHPGDVFEVDWGAGWEVFWNSAAKKGYSGTAVFSRRKVLEAWNGIGSEAHDAEGRALTVEFEDFFLVNVYVPNAQPELARIGFRQEWDAALLKYLKGLEVRKPVVCCGDFNVAHEEIDLARPKENVGEPGFSDEERVGFRGFVAAGFLDTFRMFEKGGGFYSWWSYRAGARARNVGWRIDYFIVSEAMKERVKKVWISADVLGSDHCPVGVEIE